MTLYYTTPITWNHDHVLLSYVSYMIYINSLRYIIHNTDNKYMIFQGRIWKKVSHYSVLVSMIMIKIMIMIVSLQMTCLLWKQGLAYPSCQKHLSSIFTLTILSGDSALVFWSIRKLATQNTQFNMANFMIN